MPVTKTGAPVLTLNKRSVTDRRVDLLVIQLKAAIRRILDAKGVRARVLDKVNRYGEVVIGVILERPAPAPRVGDASPAQAARHADDDVTQRESEGEPGGRRTREGEDVAP